MTLTLHHIINKPININSKILGIWLIKWLSINLQKQSIQTKFDQDDDLSLEKYHFLKLFNIWFRDFPNFKKM